MPTQYCFLCASDEGVFLDITEDNNQIFHKQFEVCSLVKVPRVDQLPAKLCHKCVYELNQCTSFVQRFKRISKQKIQSRKPCCSLCHQFKKSEFIFDLSKDQSLQHNPFDKIQKVFDYEFKNIKEDHKFVCLSCRYTLDVLFDLKNLSKETVIKVNNATNEKAGYINISKIKTTVVSRKTTITESASINLSTLQELNADSRAMIRTRSRNNKLDYDKTSNVKGKVHCGKCKIFIKKESEMYKIPEVESLVCKQCWLKSGLGKSEVENEIPSNDTKTMVCKVFLKDVLKDTELKKLKLNTIDKNGEDNRAVVVKNENLENKGESVINTRNGGSKRRFVTDVKDDNKETNNESTQSKRSKIARKQESDDSKKAESTSQETKRRKATSNARNFDSDSAVLSRRIVTRQKRVVSSISLSDADVDVKRSRRKLRSILEGNAVIQNLDLTTDGSSSNEDVVASKRGRFESTSSDPLKKKNKRVTKKGTAQQASKHAPNRQSKSTRQSKTSEESQSSECDEEVVFVTTTYICDECGASYENKLLGLTHKLTHYKQPKVQLEKVKATEVVEEETKEVTDTNDAIDEQCKDQLEAIAIRVDDDEEEPVKDTNDLIENENKEENNTEDKTQYSKKEAMEDVGMELVMKESDDDCIQTEKKTDEETADVATKTDSLAQDETEDKKEDKSSSDNNNDTYESVEKESTDTEGKQNTSLITIRDKSSSLEQQEEEKENASADNIKDTQKETSEGKDTEKPDVEECESKENDNNEKEDEDNKDEDMGEKLTRTERKDSSEEEVISLGIWEENEGVKDSEPQKNSNNDTVIDEVDHLKDDKRNSVEKKAEENKIENVGIEKQSPEFPKSKRSSKDNKNQIVEENNTSAKPLIVEDIVLSEKSITLEKDGEMDGITKSKSDASKQEQSDCVHAAAEVLQEVIDLASAEVQKRQDVIEVDEEDNSNEAETVENISREIQNSGEALIVE